MTTSTLVLPKLATFARGDLVESETLVVLVTAVDTRTFSGVVVHTTKNMYFKIGAYADDWLINTFSKTSNGVQLKP